MWIEQLRMLAMNVPVLADFSFAPFMFRAFLMLLILGIVSGVVGVIVNLRCLEFNAEAIVHSVFPGVVAGALYGGVDMILPGAGVVAVLVVLVLTGVGKYMRFATEAGTAVVLTSFFSLGVVLSLKKGDKSGQLEALMFGRIMEVTDARLIQALIVCVVALLALVFSWKAQVFVAFDRVAARTQGINVMFIDLLINAAIAAVVVAAASAVGVLLVIGFLVVPGATGRLLARKVSHMVAVAIAVGVIGGLLGLRLALIEFAHPISPQAAIALSVVALYFLALPFSKILGVVR